MKIGIIGAGVTGLALGRLLSSKFNVEILESSNKIGGIASTKTINDVTYHTIGGHCLNSKHQEVLDFIFDIIPKNNFNQIIRDAKILFKNHYIRYPIEFAIKEIYNIDKKIAFNITKDFLSTSNENSTNLEEWFINNFGDTLAQEYLIPYNTKIWNNDLRNMNYDWVIDKLPTPSPYDFFESLMNYKSDDMPHATFFYPVTNNQNDFLSALANDLNIVLNCKVTKIMKNSKKWIVNDSYKYDILINTSPLNNLFDLIYDAPADIKSYAQLLKYNKVTTMLWESNSQDFSWLYIPSQEIKFHRVINIGKFFLPNKNYMITEAIGEIDYNTMEAIGKKLDFLIKPIGHNISEHAYVVFDNNTNNVKKILMEYLDSVGMITVGRFGEWEYYNMDICIKKALEVFNRLVTQYES